MKSLKKLCFLPCGFVEKAQKDDLAEKRCFGPKKTILTPKYNTKGARTQPRNWAECAD